MSVLAVLGAGVMGSAVIEAWVAGGQDPGDIRATTLDEASASRLRERGVAVMANGTAVRDADVVVLAVKPGDVASVLGEVSPHLPSHVLVLSLCAGVSTASLQSHLPPEVAVVRVMPNTPALIGEGMSVLSAGPGCRREQLDQAVQLMRACGRVLVVPEQQQDAVTAVSGSGPAYLFHLAEAMIDAGVAQGLPRAVSAELVTQTLYGAAAMLQRSPAHPTLLREQVTSPGGTTAAALQVLNRHAVHAAVGDAVQADARRSEELSR